MNEAPKNRRLQIMPEVLPAPTVSKPGASSSSVRSQTLSHMQRLLATAAAIPLASCTRTDSSQGTQTVTIPVASTTTATTQETAQGSLLPPPSATATATAQPTATHDMGYAVVDPMPAPARCMGLASASKASAAFKKEAGVLVLEFTLTLPNGSQWHGTTFQAGAKPSSWAGPMLSSHANGSTMVVKVNVSPGSTSAGVSIPIDCAAGQGSIALNASFTSVAENAKVNLTTHDY